MMTLNNLLPVAIHHDDTHVREALRKVIEHHLRLPKVEILAIAQSFRTETGLPAYVQYERHPAREACLCIEETDSTPLLLYVLTWQRSMLDLPQWVRALLKPVYSLAGWGWDSPRAYHLEVCFPNIIQRAFFPVIREDLMEDGGKPVLRVLSVRESAPAWLRQVEQDGPVLLARLLHEGEVFQTIYQGEWGLMLRMAAFDPQNPGALGIQHLRCTRAYLRDLQNRTRAGEGELLQPMVELPPLR